MSLIQKLLRRHLSIPQFAGYSFANLLGMLIVLLSVQFYCDVAPMFTTEDSFLKKEYLVVSKHIGAAGSVSGRTNTFSDGEINDIKAQPFAKSVGKFTSSSYRVSAAMSVAGGDAVTTDLFFDAVEDKYVDAPKNVWHYTAGEQTVPIILPRSYLALYNFGFAQSRGLPRLSEGLAGLISMQLMINSNGHHDQFKGKVVGFSGRLNTILVPQTFIDWSNKRYAPDGDDEASRLVMEVDNPTDSRIAKYMDANGYEVEDNQLDAGRMTYFLKVVMGLVFATGLLISVLSFYILMLSIYLLVEKNTDKLENLLLIGYSPSRVARPYQMLTLLMNACVLVISLVVVLFARKYYIGLIALVYPQIDPGIMTAALAVGIALYILVSIANIFAIRRKITGIWFRKSQPHS